MKSVALLVVFVSLAQAAPVTMEVTRDVKVTHNSGSSETRGTLYLQDMHAPPFWIRKGHRFQMLKAESEGLCQIQFEGRKYGLTSCPWLPGFKDHQTDVFHNVDGSA